MPADTDILIYAFRQVLNLHHLNQGKVALRVDAENSLNRDLHAAFMCLFFSHTGASSQLKHALYGTQLYLSVGGPLIQYKQGTQQGYNLWMLLFALFIQPLIDHINENCKLDYNIWCADD